MTLETLENRLVEELRDLFDSEKKLTKALPKLAKAATEPELRDALEAHLEETKGHVERLKEAFAMLESPARGTPCKGIQGILQEAEKSIAMERQDLLRDIALISSAQRAEHYEIAGYRSVIRYAEHLGLSDVREVLEKTLQDEEVGNLKLASICESLCNEAARTRAAAGGSAAHARW